MKKSNVLICSALLALCACNSKDHNTVKDDGMTVIDVDNPVITDELPLEQLIDTVCVVKLQGEDLLIKRIISMQKSGDRIFVNDDDSESPIKIFDGNGLLINTIHKGNGPGEVDYLDDLYFDNEKQTLYMSNMQKWSLFDRDGNFKEQIDIPFQYSQMNSIADEYVFFVADYQMNENIKSKIFVTDKDFNLRHKYFPFEVERSFSVGGMTQIVNVGNAVAVMRDTIYYYHDSRLAPRYYFKYDNRFDPKTLPQGTSIFFDQLVGYNPVAFLENPSTVFYHIHGFDTKISKKIVYDKKSGKYFVRPFVYEDNKAPIIPFYLNANYVTPEGYFVTYLTDENCEQYTPDIEPFMSDSDKEILNNFQPDDNPLLVFFKFKEF